LETAQASFSEMIVLRSPPSLWRPGRLGSPQ